MSAVQGQGWVLKDVTEVCSEFWEGGAFEAAHGKAANELCKCQSFNLCGHSLKIKAGGKKRIEVSDFFF